MKEVLSEYGKAICAVVVAVSLLSIISLNHGGEMYELVSSLLPLHMDYEDESITESDERQLLKKEFTDSIEINKMTCKTGDVISFANVVTVPEIYAAEVCILSVKTPSGSFLDSGAFTDYVLSEYGKYEIELAATSTSKAVKSGIKTVYLPVSPGFMEGL
ncbi:MAG: hypothetical protein K6F37_09170 [Lachnospiraceae bacterium]|nr:hypothetical protein [Lachnospiraceae bacterium]